MFHGKGSVFLLNVRHAADVAFWSRPPLGCFGEESFESRGSDIDEHMDSLIRIILERMDRTPRSVDAIAGKHVSPGIVKEKTNPAFNEVEPLVFAFVVVQSGATAGRGNIEKCGELLTGLLAIEQYDHCVAKCMQCTALVGSYKERATER